jgi:antitoxin component YwqK of YwqJK toxin-antitoxin module
MGKSIYRHALAVMALAIFLASGCDTPVPEAQTVIKYGRLYVVGEEKPFTGVLKGTDSTHGKPGMRFEKEYVEGIQEGDTYYFYENGVLAAREHYSRGLANGIATYYDERGRLKASIHLEDGLRGGEHGEAFFVGMKH